MADCSQLASGKGYTPFLCGTQRNTLKGKKICGNRKSKNKKRRKEYDETS